jgi:hypothetical protein
MWIFLFWIWAMKFKHGAMLCSLQCVLIVGPWIAATAQVSDSPSQPLHSDAATPVLSIAWPSARTSTSSPTKTHPPIQGFKSEGRCIEAAANFHGVNASILQAILMTESGMNPLVINQNKNGTIDVGLGGMNSSHFSEIAKFGIAPEHLLDECVATYVTAWQLKKGINQFGNTWFGVAAYHSTTPYYNNRYQVLLFNQLVSDHVLPGPKLIVPRLEH